LSKRLKIYLPEVEGEEDDFTPVEDANQKLIKIWKKGQNLLRQFWIIWRDEYLQSLRERHQTELKSSRIQSSQSPQIGDIVLVKENRPRPLK
jgi:hypothetical protein